MRVRRTDLASKVEPTEGGDSNKLVKLHRFRPEVDDTKLPYGLVTVSSVYHGENLRPTSIHRRVPPSTSTSPLRYQKQATSRKCTHAFILLNSMARLSHSVALYCICLFQLSTSSTLVANQFSSDNRSMNVPITAAPHAKRPVALFVFSRSPGRNWLTPLEDLHMLGAGI